MAEQELSREKAALFRDLKKRTREGVSDVSVKTKGDDSDAQKVEDGKKGRWSAEMSTVSAPSDAWDSPAGESNNHVAETPLMTPGRESKETNRHWGDAAKSKKNRWDSTPMVGEVLFLIAACASYVGVHFRLRRRRKLRWLGKHQTVGDRRHQQRLPLQKPLPQNLRYLAGTPWVPRRQRLSVE